MKLEDVDETEKVAELFARIKTLSYENAELVRNVSSQESRAQAAEYDSAQWASDFEDKSKEVQFYIDIIKTITKLQNDR
jgi:hypothetical protein